ncbi:F-box/LRR-repeat protein 2-like [Aphidius gifuensis]|uniref:F-box/LRR-repeat protein 2-like n=1 Tax=Aphidius gifuensis TaxID=684658 RepID=UPI001CDBB6F7|nr:F-box/LRR-repeat protein 2-like [Aphidius gifuensis]
MLLPVPERIAIKKVCSKWKEACELAWYDIKNYSFGGGVFDGKLLAPSYVEEALSNFGIYLRVLALWRNCNSSVMPIIEHIDININHWDIKTPNILNNILNSSKSIRYCNIMLHPDCNAPDISIKNWDNLLNLEHLGTRWRINNNTAIKLVKYCKNLRSLDIRSEGIIETALQKLTELKNLDTLNYSFADGIAMDELDNAILTISNTWKKLKHLTISDDSPPDDIDVDNIEPFDPSVIYDELSKLQYLEELNVLNMRDFQDSSIIAIANSSLMSIISLENLEELNVGNIDGVTDNFISKLKGLKKLRCEYSKNITDAGMIQCLKNCPNLEALCLYHSNITINTLVGADEITQNRINNIVLYLFYNNSTEASKLKTKSKWLVLRPGKRNYCG